MNLFSLFTNQPTFRRWLIPHIVVGFVVSLYPLWAEDSAAPIPDLTPADPATTEASAPLIPHAGALALRDTAAGESAISLAAAATRPPPPAAPAPAPSPNAMVNLVNLLVAQHVITKGAGDALITQAEQEADSARAQIAATQATTERLLTAQQSAPTIAAAPSTAPTSEDVQVSYVPEVVKNQIRDEVTQDVLKQDRDERLADTAAANAVPDWVKRYRVAGDFRLRYEGDFYPHGNSVGSFTNFNAINTGSPISIAALAGNQFPQYNVDQERDRFRLRARIGAEIDLGQNFTAGMRVGTGADNSPVTENQTLGAANSGQGGNFSKYAIWLDRGFLKYELSGQPNLNLSLTFGRFDNPFFHTSMLFSDDLGFDGAVVQAKYKINDGLTPFFIAGGFPVFNTDLNFSSTQSAKFSSEDKYLVAAQAGTNWAINKDFNLKVGAAYYNFIGVDGRVSDPLTSDALPGNTDDSRPAFAQNGNTYIALRDYEDPTDPLHSGTSQYFGLATPFHELALTAQLDYSGFDPFHLWLTGEFVKNLAFDRNAILNNGSPDAPGPVNNLSNPTDSSSFDGGDIGWNVKLNAGKVSLEKLWDWNLSLAYRYVQSDATVDGFTDSDFGGALAGTNLKGYVIGGNLALSPRVWASLRWMSAEAIAGPPYKNDLIQVDLNAKF